MKKRLRKKTHRGEFKELGFVMTAEYDEKPDMESLCEFADQLMDKLEELGMDVTGYFDFSDFDVLLNTGRPGSDEENRRNQAIEFVKAQPGIRNVEAGELVDAWHNDL